MFRRCLALPRRALALAVSPRLLSRQHTATSFQPFSQKDEDDLVRVIKTKPRHVLKHVRQSVWRSRKRELHFRNTVTHLMIVLQEFLRKQLIDAAYASEIMEGVLEECVAYGQHDMAHLLFRAFLRFRKYGCVISVNAIRYLFESYKANDSAELMLQLANEMREDAALRPLCVAAYLFANHEAEATSLLEGISFADLSRDDVLALISGYEKLGKMDAVLDIVAQLKGSQQSLSPEDLTLVYAALLRAFAKRNDNDGFTQTLQAAVDAKAPLSGEIFTIILRQKMRGASSVEEISAIEEELKTLGYAPDVTGNSIIITAYARLHHFGDRGSEELMLSKVDTLLSSIESRLKQGDPDMDISAAHIRAVIRGYGAAGRAEAIKDAWERLQFKSLTQDVRIYNELFKWLALMGNVKDVLALRDEMKRAGVNADSLTYTWILRSLGKYYPRHVEQIYQEISDRHIRPDTQLYNTLIGIYGDLQEYDKVDALVAEMRKREGSGTLQYTPITFAVLIRIYAKDVSKAEAIFSEAKQRNLAEHPHVQTAMLNAYATAARHEHRTAASPSAKTGTSSENDGSPDGDESGGGAGTRASAGEVTQRMEQFLTALPVWGTDVYNVLLNLYGKQHEREKFQATLEKMKQEQVAMNDVTFGTLITAFARWGDAAKVNEVIQLLKDHEGEVSAAFYSVLASSLNRLGNASGVSDAWDDLLSSKLFPGTEVYNQFLTLYSRQHDVSKMQGVLDNMMKQVPPNPVTATTVLDMLGKSGRVSEMESLFEDMKATADTQPTSVTFHQVMNAYAKSGDVAKMEKVHQEFLDRGYVNNNVTYNILVDGYGRAKGFEQMEETLARRRAAEIPFDDITYCILITTYGKAKSEKDVMRYYKEVTDPTNANLLTKRVAWSCVDAFCRCGNSELVDKAVETLAAANDGGALSPADKSGLIPYFCRMGRMDRVEDLEKEVASANGSLSYSTLNSIARGYARAGRFDKTVETLHRLRDKNWVPDASTALQLSGAFLKAGLHEQAKQIIEWRRQYAKMAGSAESNEPQKTET